MRFIHALLLLWKRKAVHEMIPMRIHIIIYIFTELCWIIKLINYTDDELKLKLFCQSLTNTALSWYRTCPAEEKNDTWENLMKEFIFRFYPKVKSAEERRFITNFKDRRGESLMRAYLRFKGMVWKLSPSWFTTLVCFTCILWRTWAT